MNNQQQQRFCVNCGQVLTPGVAFCTACGTQVVTQQANSQGQVAAGAQQMYQQSYPLQPVQSQDDPLLTGLAAGYVGSQMGRRSRQRTMQPHSKLRGYGCLLLFLVILIGPFIGFALTKGTPHLIFTYLAVGLVLIFVVLVLIVMLLTRGGREVLSEGCAEGCLDALLGGIFGG